MSSELAKTTDGGRAAALFSPGKPQDMMNRFNEMRAYVSQAMVKGFHYDTIPGTQKPTLLKPGAEDLCIYYQLSPQVTVTHRVEDWEGNFFHYEVLVELVSRITGQVMGSGIGSCNSKEAKYAYRWVYGSDVPTHLNKDQLVQKEFTGKNGKPYKKYRVDNDDLPSQVNTLLKMAKKRGFTDAVLTTTGASIMFTQDVEDFMGANTGEYVEPAPPPPAEDAPFATDDFASLEKDLNKAATVDEIKKVWPRVEKAKGAGTLTDEDYDKLTALGKERREAVKGNAQPAMPV